MTRRYGAYGKRYSRAGRFAAAPSGSTPPSASPRPGSGAFAPSGPPRPPKPKASGAFTPGGPKGVLTPIPKGGGGSSSVPGGGMGSGFFPGDGAAGFFPAGTYNPDSGLGVGDGSVWYRPKLPPNQVFHPPGPGIGKRRGPAPALGRPGILPGGKDGWKNDSCFSQGSKGWKPDILSLGDAHACPGNKGPQSPARPPNISNDPSGYNTRLFQNENDVAKALEYLGYRSPDGNAMIRRFQRHWNLVSSRLAYAPALYASVQFAHEPIGNLQVDGDIGPNVLNGIEIAIVNQRMNPQLAWPNVIEMVTTAGDGSGYGKQKLYNAVTG